MELQAKIACSTINLPKVINGSLLTPATPGWIPGLLLPMDTGRGKPGLYRAGAELL